MAFTAPGGQKPRWADLQDTQDSSQENGGDSQPVPISQGSYVSPDSLDESRGGVLSELLASKAVVASQPRQESPQSPGIPEGDEEEEARNSGGAANPMPSSSAEGDSLAPMSQRLQAWRPQLRPASTAAQSAVSRGDTVVAEAQTWAPTVLTPFTPQRRRPRQRYEAHAAVSTPGSKRLRSSTNVKGAAAPKSEAREEADEWLRRNERRRSAVAAIKGKPEYEHMAGLRDTGALPSNEVPLTPDPDDSTVSKRQWEASVMQWRATLRELAKAVGGVQPGMTD